MWKLKHKTITFGNVERNTIVGTVPNVGNISHAYGMALLGSGSTVPLTFFPPDLPESLGIVHHQHFWTDYILYGSENTLQSGRITVCWEY